MSSQRSDGNMTKRHEVSTSATQIFPTKTHRRASSRREPPQERQEEPIPPRPPNEPGVAADDPRSPFLVRHQDWIRQSFALEAATAPPGCVVAVGTLDQDPIWHLFASHKG